MAKWISIVTAMMSICLGCNLAPPRLQSPGPLQYQHFRATLHDPYVDNDAGPEAVGVRPREYDKPLAEPVRARWLTDSWWGF